jgi:hypothetical protein
MLIYTQDMLEALLQERVRYREQRNLIRQMRGRN